MSKPEPHRGPPAMERQRRQRQIGLRQPPPSAPRAALIERWWRLPMLVALLLTIPAFYADLLRAVPPWVADLAYFVAALVVATALLSVARKCPSPAEHVRANLFDLALASGLLVAAAAPSSAVSQDALAARLLVAFMVLVRMIWALQHLVTRGSTVHLMALAFLVLLLCGAGFWWLEPSTPTLADGLWLAFTTAATVGYGDVYPTTAASKIFAVFVVLLGFGVLTLVTAAIATSWIETEERRIEREILTDLRTQMSSVHADLAALRAEVRSAARLYAEQRHAAAASGRVAAGLEHKKPVEDQ